MKPLAGHGEALGLRGQLTTAVACAGQATAAVPPPLACMVLLSGACRCAVSQHQMRTCEGLSVQLSSLA